MTDTSVEASSFSAIIRWPVHEQICFLGRNGYGKCTGLEISGSDEFVTLRPITSKNEDRKSVV